MSSWSEQMLEGLTRFYHEDREGGRDYTWTRCSDDPIEVSLRISANREATGKILLRAYLVDHELVPRAYTRDASENLRDLVRRMDILESWGIEGEEARPFYRGVEVRYRRNIVADEDIARMVEDFNSIL